MLHGNPRFNIPSFKARGLASWSDTIAAPLRNADWWSREPLARRIHVEHGGTCLVGEYGEMEETRALKWNDQTVGHVSLPNKAYVTGTLSRIIYFL